MAETIRPLAALLLSAAVLLMGNGLQTVLLPLRADAEAFDAASIGLMGSAYFIGLIAGCFICPLAIARVGHIRSFTAFTALATVAPLAHALFPVEPMWWALRVLTGFCFAGLLMVIEGWLNAVATPANRGRVLAIYTTINLTVVTIGQLLLMTGDPAQFELFALVAILMSLAAVPVALTRTDAPVVPRQPDFKLGRLFAVSPIAFIGSLGTGFANAAFWSLGALYAKGIGFDTAGVAVFLTVASLGGAAAQWPLGLWSDRTDRRVVLIVAAVLASVASFALSQVPSAPGWGIYALAAAYGASAIPIYALCVAHANDHVTRDDAVHVSSSLLLTYSMGAIIGPLTASLVMDRYGAQALFAYAGVVYVLIAVAAGIRMAQRARPPDATREPFVAVPRTSQAVFELDPRAEPPTLAKEGG